MGRKNQSCGLVEATRLSRQGDHLSTGELAELIMLARIMFCSEINKCSNFKKQKKYMTVKDTKGIALLK